MHYLPDDVLSYINEYSELKEKYNLATSSRFLVNALLTYHSPLARELSHYYAQRSFCCKLNSNNMGYNETLLLNRAGYFWTMPIIRGSFWSVHISKVIKISHNGGSKIVNIYYLNAGNGLSIKPLMFKNQVDIQNVFIRFAENSLSRYMEKNNI